MRKIGRYEIRGMLGRGGMSTVFKAAMPVTGKIVALKLMTSPELLVDILGLDELKKLFTTEAVIMAGLRHPNIAEVWDFDEHDGMPFFVMDFYCNNLGLFIGEHFRVEEPSRRLEFDKVFHYGKQILDGLSCLHQAGIIHRDIKPYNILITDQDTVKIADFGMSKLHGDPFPKPGNLRVGSPFYAAPEQEVDPDAADARADVYSVGIMLYRMITGAFPGTTGKGDFGAGGGPFTQRLREFLGKAIERDIELRFVSAQNMRSDLLELEERWLSEKETVCRFFDPEDSRTVDRVKKRPIRSEPVKVAPGRARYVFGLDGLSRPAQYAIGDFVDNGDGTVTDHAAGLVWQQSGSDYHMPWRRAREYVNRLNRDRFAGRTDWRLPTVSELLTLLGAEKTAINDYCIPSVFDRTRKWLWSIDRRSYVAAWYVSVDLGFVAWQDFSCYYYVRAVCSA